MVDRARLVVSPPFPVFVQSERKYISQNVEMCHISVHLTYFSVHLLFDSSNMMRFLSPS